VLLQIQSTLGPAFIYVVQLLEIWQCHHHTNIFLIFVIKLMLSIKEKKLGPRPNSHKEMQKNTKYMSTQISVG